DNFGLVDSLPFGKESTESGIRSYTLARFLSFARKHGLQPPHPAIPGCHQKWLVGQNDKSLPLQG
ncbi:hypothetical protein, partial [Meiothermus hypogaeus]|uniref:hypothetical protein n=1 Tax=Meiothermus hypogaeus TaxID=884155 RepID=UPI001C99DD4A